MKKKTNLEKLMNYLFETNSVDYTFLDDNSPAYNYWKRYIKKQKTNLK